MISAGDIITTNYHSWGETWRVVEVRRDCACGRWRRWPLRYHAGRQRLPHCHIVAVDERGERAWWNGLLERDGRLIESSRIWHKGRRIHPEIKLITKAEQGSLF